MYIRPQLKRRRTENREVLFREHVNDAEITMWETNSIDKDMLVKSSWEMYQQYLELLENSKVDLEDLTKKALQ